MCGSDLVYGKVDYDTKDPFGTAFCLLYYKRDQTIRAIAIIAVLVFGIQALRGKISWTSALIVCTGIIIIMADIIVRSILKSSTGYSGYICE